MHHVAPWKDTVKTSKINLRGRSDLDLGACCSSKIFKEFKEHKEFKVTKVTKVIKVIKVTRVKNI